MSLSVPLKHSNRTVSIFCNLFSIVISLLVWLYSLHHYDVITGLSANDSNWYQTVTGKLTTDQIELLQTLVVYAEQRRAQAGQLL